MTDSLPALALAFDPASKDVMNRKPTKPGKGVFSKGMTWRIIYQGIMIGTITLVAFCLGLNSPNVDDSMKIKIGQTMAFCVLAFSELVHVFNIRNNKVSIFKGGLLNNTKLLLAILISSAIMSVVLLIPALRNIFSIALLPMENIIELVILVFSPIVLVELFKLLKINTSKEE